MSSSLVSPSGIEQNGRQLSDGASGTSLLAAPDKIVLARALARIRAARQAMSSTDPAVVAKGQQQLSIIVGYITGYMDGMGIGSVPAPGFDALFPSDAKSTLDEALDQLELVLEGATGGGAQLFLSVGDAVVALGEAITAVGHALQSAGI